MAGPGGTAIDPGLSALILPVITGRYACMIRRFPITGGAFTCTDAAFCRRTRKKD